MEYMRTHNFKLAEQVDSVLVEMMIHEFLCDLQMCKGGWEKEEGGG